MTTEGEHVHPPSPYPAPGPAPQACPVPPTGSIPPGGPATRVTGVVLARDQFAAADTSIRFENPDLMELLSKPIPGLTHAVLDFSETDVTILDIDNHDAAVTREAVDAVIRSLRGWDVAHPTHRDGAHVFFKGPGNHERAVLAVLGVPQGLGVEIKRQARHPLAIHPDAPGATAGPPMIGPGPEAGDGSAGVVIDTTARDRWLAEHNMQIGGRYPHELCPIDPCASSGSSPVAVYDDRIVCYRCQAQGVSVSGAAAGTFPFEQASAATQLRKWARSLVHWGQLAHVVGTRYPHIPLPVLREAYELLLHEEHGGSDPRIPLVFTAGKDTVLTASGDWVLSGARGLQQVERPSGKLLNRLPTLRYSVAGKKSGKMESKTDDEKLAKACLGWMPGYPRVQFLRPPIPVALRTDDPGVAFAPDPAYRDVRLLDEPLAWDICCAELEAAFPGIQPHAVVAMLAAVFCIQNRRGQPPILFVTGPSGSGKNATTGATAGFLGEYPQQLDFSMNDEKLSRSLGLGCSLGQRVFQSDELGKDPKLAERIPAVLRLSSRTTMRNLYVGQSLNVATPMVLIITCTNLPFMLTDLDEMVRRTRVIRLPRVVPNWALTCGGDVRDWPTYATRNRQIANSVLTHAWQCAQQHGFDWDAVATSLGLGWLRDAETANARRTAIVALYEDCRSSTLFSMYPRFAGGGWLNIEPLSPRVAACTGVVPDEGSPDWIDQSAQELSAIDWNSQLGIAEPAIQCQVRRNGRQGVIRFVEAGQLRGAERRNGQLPPASAGSTPSA